MVKMVHRIRNLSMSEIEEFEDFLQNLNDLSSEVIPNEHEVRFNEYVDSLSNEEFRTR